jgi:hypothetical protein
MVRTATCFRARQPAPRPRAADRGAGILPNHRGELIEDAFQRLLVAQDDGGLHAHLVAQAGDFGGQRLQGPADTGQVDGFPLAAHPSACPRSAGGVNAATAG